jgi:hypothetical protein
VALQVAEAPRERDMLGTANLLIAKEQDAMLEQVRANLGKEAIVVDRVGKPDTHQFGANGVAELFDMHVALLK